MKSFDILSILGILLSNGIKLIFAVPGILVLLIGIISVLTAPFELSLGLFLFGIVCVLLGGGWILWAAGVLDDQKL